MGLADELERLEGLFSRGVLNREEFQRAKEQLLSAQVGPPPVLTPISGKFLDQVRRSPSDCWLGGVCGGLGEITPIPSWAWRIAFSLFAFYFGVGVILYVLFWIFVPERT